MANIDVRKLARLINQSPLSKTWDANPSIESPYLCIDKKGTDESIEFVQGLSDYANSLWIVWGLEQLQILGWDRFLYPEKDYFVCVGIKGATRSEAIANALLLVLDSSMRVLPEAPNV